jgi:hypothetical protein
MKIVNEKNELLGYTKERNNKIYNTNGITRGYISSFSGVLIAKFCGKFDGKISGKLVPHFNDENVMILIDR